VDFVKQGKLNRASGARFELKVRDILEKDGFIVDKWTNNIDLIERKLVKAKRKYNPFMKALSVGTGFPDFICFKRAGELFDIIGVEVKKRGYLVKEEKEKAKIYLEQKIFNKFLIAEPKKDGKRGEVSLVSFEEKYLSKN
jgi:hypothetical protein